MLFAHDEGVGVFEGTKQSGSALYRSLDIHVNNSCSHYTIHRVVAQVRAHYLVTLG